MDEPTNHLDLDMISWLEEYLAGKDVTLLLITHDRYFLDKVCNIILELDNGKIYKHEGNYEYYLEKKKSRQTTENINIDKTKLFLKKEAEWIRRQPQGRQSKASARIDSFYQLQDSLKPKNITEKVNLEVINRRMGRNILELQNVNKAFAKNVILHKFNYEFNKGEKIGIIGNNGVGKTTFLNIIRGIELPDSGKIITGPSVVFGYYSQEQTELTENIRVIDSVREIASNIKLADGSEITAAKMLERFLFSPTDQQNLVANLSGGEKKRLFLLRILMKNPNFLILDEPTNDFDLVTLDVLEEFLRNFPGCLIVISHDRYFMDSIIDHLFIFKGQGVIEDFVGNYSDYRLSIEGKPNNQNYINNINKELANDKKHKTNEASKLYKEISNLEKKKNNLIKKLTNSNINYLDSATASKELKKLQVEIDEKTEFWLEKSA